MTFNILTLFPELFEGFLKSSILGRALEQGLITVRLTDIRDYAADRHRICDDYAYGGGPGMVMKPEPIAAAIEAVGAQGRRVVYLTPAGRLYTQGFAREFSREKEVTLLCGRYEGIDQRVIDTFVTDELSIGDYVLSGGEVAAMAVVDSVARLVDGVIAKESLEEESFSLGMDALAGRSSAQGGAKAAKPGMAEAAQGWRQPSLGMDALAGRSQGWRQPGRGGGETSQPKSGWGLLEYPHYTRPEVFRGLRVPEVLLSGHHEMIRRWRLEKSVQKTLRYRPDLLASEDLPAEVKKILSDLNES